MPYGCPICKAEAGVGGCPKCGFGVPKTTVTKSMLIEHIKTLEAQLEAARLDEVDLVATLIRNRQSIDPDLDEWVILARAIITHQQKRIEEAGK